MCSNFTLISDLDPPESKVPQLSIAFVCAAVLCSVYHYTAMTVTKGPTSCRPVVSLSSRNLAVDCCFGVQPGAGLNCMGVASYRISI